MNGLKRGTGILGGVVALLLSLLVAPAGRASVQPALSWGPCGDDVPAVYQCATAKVPLDHRRPHGRTVEVALIRQPASDPEHRIGSLFVAHPMGTFDFIASAPPGALAGFSRFDVIGYDGRGAARAKPAIDCDTDRSLLEPFGTRQTAPGRLDVPAMVKAAKRYGKDCAASNGDLLPQMSTAAMARDLDLLRRAVGDQLLTYIGISQGSVIGATYASMFPGKVRAMVFDAVVDARTWTNDPLRAFAEQNAETEDVLGRFLTACAAEPQACGFGAGKPRAALDRLMNRLDRHPAPSPDPQDPFPVDGDDVRAALLEAMYSPNFWKPFATALADAERGDYAALRNRARHGFDNGAINDPVAPSYNLWRANMAADARFPDRIKDYLRYGAETRARYPHLGSGYGLMVEGLWPAEPAEVFRGPFRNPASNAPILLIGGTHDLATPYRWAQRMAGQLGNARLMTYDGEGHGSLNDGDLCILLPVLRYLTDGTLPAAGTVCKQTFDPFPG